MANDVEVASYKATICRMTVSHPLPALISNAAPNWPLCHYFLMCIRKHGHALVSRNAHAPT